MIFPLRKRPEADYHIPPRAFGSNRASGQRKHAGCDLYAPKGTEILAMADGTVTLISTTFYRPNDQAEYVGSLEVWHGPSIGKIRYAEIDRVADGLAVGSKVSAGQVIAFVGQVAGMENAMLHVEMFKGILNGPLTNKSNPPFERRADLFDPTSTLDAATLSPEA